MSDEAAPAIDRELLAAIDLPGLVERAAASDEFAPLCREAGLDAGDLLKEISPKMPVFLAVAQESVSAFLKADAELKSASELRYEQLAKRGEEPKRTTLFVYRMVVVVGFMLALLGTPMAIFIWLNPTLAGKPLSRADAITLTVLYAVFALGGCALLIWAWIKMRRWGAYLRRYAALEVMPYEEISALAKKRDGLKQQMDEFIYVQCVRGEVSGILNRETLDSYATQLGEFTASGLSEVFTLGHEVETEAKRNLDDLLRLPGGSIGLAGSRGAGKTTLMSLVARRPGSKGKACYVMCPAPVEYGGRDYLLTLFLLLCNWVLEDRGGGGAADATEGRGNESRLPAWILGSTKLLPQAMLYLQTGGLALLFLGALLAFLFSQNPIPAAPAQAPQAATAKAAATQTASPPAVVAPSKAAVFAAQSVPYLKMFGVDPARTVWWGIVLLAAGYGAGVVRRQLLLRRFRSYADGPRSTRRTALERMAREEDEREFEMSHKREDALARAARMHRESLRFQQSYTSGWSGSLKMPMGLEGGVNNAHSLSRNQRSLPELVGEFRDFLRDVATEYGRVCICVDELDKMESDDKAHLFLNEIKAIFGVTNVFYLVSVSENAISAFERRGLPFRDVFDSSFDAIVHVDYLKLEESKNLLKRRTTRVPEPFLCLSHCMSGGLPRDLIRTCRQMLDIAKDENQFDLLALARRVIMLETKGKARGMSIAASKLSADADQTNFLSALTEILTRRLDETSLLARAVTLLSSADELRDRVAKMSMSVDAPIREQVLQLSALAGLETEFGLYLAYVATVLEVMLDLEPRWPMANQEVKMKPEQWKAIPVIQDYCDRLAATRQALAISVPVGRERLVKLRSELGMDVRGIAVTVSGTGAEQPRVDEKVQSADQVGL